MHYPFYFNPKSLQIYVGILSITYLASKLLYTIYMYIYIYIYLFTCTCYTLADLFCDRSMLLSITRASTSCHVITHRYLHALHKFSLSFTEALYYLSHYYQISLHFYGQKCVEMKNSFFWGCLRRCHASAIP